MTDDLRNVALLNIFYNGTKKYRVIFHNNHIVWATDQSTLSDKIAVRIEDVISIDQAAGSRWGSISSFCKEATGTHTNSNAPFGFTIHYVERIKEKLKYKFIHFRHKDSLQVSSWVNTLQNYLHYHTDNYGKRPKRILLFINPIGGRRNALNIYNTYGKKLFEIADVDVTVNISQRQYQIRDYVLNHDLDMFDAVAVVGGDGTVSELFNGLVLRECRLMRIDPNDMNQNLPKPKLPVGIIPGGSTDTIIYSLNGTSDPTTAVLNIIFGRRLGLDLVSVYDDRNLLRLYASAFSYGFLGDVAHHSDKYRWMGPSRYSFSGFKALLCNKAYEGELSYLNEVDAIDESQCFEDCRKCIDAPLKQIKCQWKTISGKFFMISGANITCACTRSPCGIAPNCHLGDGFIYLLIVNHTSILNNLKLLLKLSSREQNNQSISNGQRIDSMPFLQVYRAQEFYFRAINGTGYWNCDGEVQQQTDIRAKVRCQLLDVFASGCPRFGDEMRKQCCRF